MKVKPEILLYIVIISIIIIGVVDFYYPFLHHSSTELLDNVRHTQQIKDIKKQTYDEIHKIEEDSLIKVNTDLGGIDEVNGDNKAVGITQRKQIMFQENKIGYFGDDIKEGFLDTPKNTILRLFYKTNCGYSQQFLPNWYELTRQLPSGVKYEEVNCDIYDNFGITKCSKYMITRVPTIQLVRINEKGDETIEQFNGKREYLNIKDWLGKLGIELRHNYDSEHFINNDPDHLADHLYIRTDADGKYKPHLDQLKRNITLKDEMGNYRDVDDGCYIASFSKCKEGSQNPGYKIFTQRGQYGCVYPDVNTGINDSFDAGFAVTASYLDNLPPKQDPKTGKLIPYQADEKKKQMLNCAVKYGNEIRGFGLCDGEKLAEKSLILKHLDEGKLKLPPGLTKEDYKKTKDIAESIMVGSCGI